MSDALLRGLNDALYRAFFADEAAGARWERIKDELDDETRGALSFGLINLGPIPPEDVAFFRRLHGESA